MNKITTAWASFFLVMCFGQSFYVLNGIDQRSNPSVIDYQGYLTDLSNAPITNPAQPLTFGIYSASSGGTPIWSETQSAVNVKQGIFHVLLGSVVPLPDTVFTKNSTRWLALTVGSQVMTPRTRIVSAGYAYHAGHADSVEYARFPTEDFDWTRGAPDSVLFTYRQLGIARGDAGDSLLGLNRFTHVNFGTSSNTGATGSNYTGCAITGGLNIRDRGDYSTVVGGNSNKAAANYAVAAGGINDSIATVYGGILAGANNLVGDEAVDSGAVMAGGQYNKAVGKYSLVLGGIRNYVVNQSVAFGGNYDSVKTFYSGILTGDHNIAGLVSNDTGCVIGSGYYNEAGSSYNAIGSGRLNTVSGDYSAVLGGNSNESKSTYGGILTGYSHLLGNGANDSAMIIGGGYNNLAVGKWAAVTNGSFNESYGSYSILGGGRDNLVSGDYAGLAGGEGNLASGTYSLIGGGFQDTADWNYTACLSGYGVKAQDTFAVAGGGYHNIVRGEGNALAGGRDNQANTGKQAVLFGGYGNDSRGDSAVVGGGNNNLASYVSFMGGGNGNSANGINAVIFGGSDNLLTGRYTVCLGGSMDSTFSPMCGLLSGYGNLAGIQTFDTASVVGGGVSNRLVGRFSVVAGGYGNNLSGWYNSTIGGRNNYNRGNHSTIFGGDTNHVMTDYGGSLSGRNNRVGLLYSVTGNLICGGSNNFAENDYTTVGGGMCDTAKNLYSTVAGGAYNRAITAGAYIGGGLQNYAAGDGGTVAGGRSNSTSNDYGTAAGGYDSYASGFAGVASGAYSYAGQYGAAPGGLNDTAAAFYSFAVGNHSVVRSGTAYNGSAAFNGQAATAASELRCGVMAKTGGSFTIDHPLDPGGKILNHYFVESPDMSNVYRGIALTGQDGRAVVHLPAYFDRLNKEPFIQLTAEGSTEWVYIEQNVKDNAFVIRGAPNTRIHWLVTGARQDQPAEIIRTMMPVEQDKDGELAGRMLDDDFLVSVYGQLKDKGITDRYRFRSEQGRIRAQEVEARSKEGR